MYARLYKWPAILINDVCVQCICVQPNVLKAYTKYKSVILNYGWFQMTIQSIIFYHNYSLNIFFALPIISRIVSGLKAVQVPEI
jgi:hypothetical protein